MPCKDASAAHNKSATYQLAKESKQSIPFTDNCSPFCQCNCCAGFSVNYSVAYITVIPMPFISKPQAAYLPSSALEVALAIWQPPQL